MRTIRFIVHKELLQIVRNRAMVAIMLGMPVIQLIILSNAATFELKNITMHVVDLDQSTASRRLLDRFPASGYFQTVESSFSDEAADDDIRSNRARLIVKIPREFERDLVHGRAPAVQFVINAEDGQAASLTQAYATTILNEYGRELRARAGQEGLSEIKVESAYWYNPVLDYKTYMIPGILVALVSMIGMFLTGMNIVREKEIGTIEQLNVTPILKYQFIAGKLIPFWMIGLFELALGLLVAWLIFDIPMVGSLWLVFGMTALYLLVVLGIGLFISTFTETQQQAMFIAWFFMVIFMLMGGLFTPIDSMPAWAQTMTKFNPIAHFVDIMRRMLLKGAAVGDILPTLAFLVVMAVTVLGLAVLRYRKVTD